MGFAKPAMLPGRRKGYRILLFCQIFGDEQALRNTPDWDGGIELNGHDSH